VFNQRLAAINTELTEKNAELERISRLDHLTQTFNRIQTDSDLEREISRSHRYERPFSIVFVDIDHFKRINDTHGHQTGDQVLKDFAKLVQKKLRENDVFGRWGGEEFVLLCPETDGEGARDLAEKLRATIANHTFSSGVSVTASFGVAQLRTTEDRESLIKRTDEALYKAKSDGRNAVRVA